MKTRTQISGVVISPADEAVLRAHVNKNTAAIILTSHPEFFTDAQIDNWLAKKYFPNSLFWMHDKFFQNPRLADFLTSINVVSHKSGLKGLHKSMDSVMAGNAVLLKPEGGVTGSDEMIRAFMPGDVEMAYELAERIRNVAQSRKEEPRPAYIVPIVWKYVFDGDVSSGLQKQITLIGQKMGLPANPGLDMPSRFFALQKNMLRKLAKDLSHYLDSHPDKPGGKSQIQTMAARQYLGGIAQGQVLTNDNYFSVKANLQKLYLAALEDMFGSTIHQDIKQHVFYEDKLDKCKAATDKPEAQERYRVGSPLLQAFRYLAETDERIYNAPTLTQEHMAECLLRIIRLYDLSKSDILPPVSAGTRKSYVKVAEPIDLNKVSLKRPWFQKAALQESIRSRMQSALRDLEVNEIAPNKERIRYQNLLCSQPQIQTLSMG